MLHAGSSRRRSGRTSQNGRRRFTFEPLEQRELLAVNPRPEYLDASKMTTELVSQYGQVIIGPLWQSQLQMSAEALLEIIQTDQFDSFIEGNANDYVVNFRHDLGSLGADQAQKLFNEKLDNAHLPRLNVAHLDWFDDRPDQSAQPLTAAVATATSPTFVGPLTYLPAAILQGATAAPQSESKASTLAPDEFPVAISLVGGPGTLRIKAIKANVAEGEEAKFEAWWDGERGDGFTVEYHTADGSAVADGDYPSVSSHLTFHDGDEGSTATIPIATNEDAPDGSTPTTPTRPRQENFTLSFGSPVVILGEDDGEGLPNVSGSSQTITINDVAGQETPNNDPDRDEDDDDCDCGCDAGTSTPGSNAQGVNSTEPVANAIPNGPGQSFAPSNDVLPQPLNPYGTSDFAPRVWAVPLDGNLLVNQPIVPGPLARETALTYRSERGRYPVVNIDTVVPALASSSTKVLVGATATLSFTLPVEIQGTAGYSSTTGIAQGEDVSFTIEGDAVWHGTSVELPTGMYDYTVTVVYSYELPTGGGAETLTASYRSKQFVVNREDFVNSPPAKYIADGWYINGLDEVRWVQWPGSGTNTPVVIFGNGDVAVFERREGGVYKAPGFEVTLSLDEGNGATLTFDNGTTEYLGGGSIRSKTYASGRTITYNYVSGTNELDSISDSDGNIVSFYDGIHYGWNGVDNLDGSILEVVGGELRSITAPDPGDDPAPVTTFTYDSSGRMETLTAGNDVKTKYVYDGSSGRLSEVRHVDPGTDEIKSTYLIESVYSKRLALAAEGEFVTSSRVAATFIDERGKASLITVDQNDKVLSIVDEETEDTKFSITRNEYGQPVEIVSPDPSDPYSTVTTTRTYDGSRITSATYADESTEAWTYDSAQPDKVKTHLDRMGRLTVYIIDSSTGDKLSERIVVDGDETTVGTNDVTTSYTYTQPGNLDGLKPGLLLTVIDPLGHLTTYAYVTDEGPSFGKIESITYADGTIDEATVYYEYNDSRGNLTDYYDEIGRRTHYVYDALNRLIETDLPDPDSLGDYSTNRSTILHYDAAGNVSSTENALGQVTTTTYDPNYWDAVDDVYYLRVTVQEPDADGVGTDYRITISDYDLAGNLVRSIDPLGRISQFVYDSRNRLLHSYAPDADEPTNAAVYGPETSYTYDAGGRVLTVTDPLGNVTSYGYDEMARLVTTTYEDADGAGTLHESFATTNVYGLGCGCSGANTIDQLVATIDAKGYTTSYAYDALGRLWKTFYPDASGNANPLTSTIYSENLYDKNGNLTSVTDTLGNTTLYFYDYRDRLTDVYLPDPGDGTGGTGSTHPHTHTEYYADGSINYTTDPLGRRTTYLYDDAGRQTGVTFASADATVSVTTHTSYDDLDQVETTTDARGAITTYLYDNLGRQTDIYLPDPTYGTGGTGSTHPHTHTIYDLASQITSVTDALDHTTTYEFDGQGRTIRVTSPDPDANALTNNTPIVEYTYDDNSNLKTQVTYDGTTPLTTTYNYDNLNRLTSVVQPNGDTVAYDYDDNGNQTSVTDDEGNTTTYGYDTRNRLHTETNELSATRTYEYDDNNNRTSATDRDGRVREFLYDHLGRQTDETWLDGSTVEYTDHMTYNLDGTLETNADYAGTVLLGTPISKYAYTYDKLGRLETVDNHGTAGAYHTVLTSSYDENGNRTGLSAVVYNGLDVPKDDFVDAYTYDYLNRQIQVTQSGVTGGNFISPKRVDYTYDDNSQLQTLTRYSNLAGTSLVATSTYGYDDAGRLTSLTHDLPGTTSDVVYAWTFDRTNRITAYTRSDGGTASESQTYDYDESGQLTDSSGTEPSESYTYDENGNRTNDDFDTPSGSDNRLAYDGTYYYVYDAEGNLTLRYDGTSGANVRVFSYDFRNRLTEIKDYTGASVSGGAYVAASGTLALDVTYRYDVNNLRIAKMVAGSSTLSYLYDGANVVLRFNSSNTSPEEYLNGLAIDQVLAYQNNSGGVGWALTDQLGSVRDLVNNSGTIYDHIDYSAFGEVIYETAPSTNFLFGYTGAVYDEETGLGYHRARYLDSATGRWISQDPIGFAGGVNLYSYVSNTPVNLIDPYGWKGDGHHIVPWSLFNEQVSDAVHQFFDSDMARIANDQYKIHNGKTLDGISHGTYNKLLKEELDKFLGPTALRDMTLEQAKQFLNKIKNMPPTSPISIFNNAIAKEANEAMKQALESAAKKAAHEAAGRAIAKGAKVGKVAKCAKAVPLVGTVVSVLFFASDVNAKGPVGGTINTGMDMIPLFGTAKIISEWWTGIDIIEDK